MKPRKKKPAPTACGLSGAEAQAAYEQTLEAKGGGALQAKDLADHVAACGPCSSALHVLELQGDAVAALTGRARGAVSEGADGTAIESILRVAARSGTGRLADLAYELAKACLIRLPNLERRVRRVVEPREARVVARELRTANARVSVGRDPVRLDGIPADAPKETDALRAATSCLRILEQLEGNSPRQVQGMAQVHIFEQRPALAEALLRELLTKQLPPQMAGYARINLMLSLIRQEKFAAAVAFGDELVGRGESTWEVLFNLAVAHAHLRNVRPFRSVARQLSDLVNSDDSSNLSTMVRFETPNFAADLGIESREVEQAFGRHQRTRSR